MHRALVLAAVSALLAGCSTPPEPGERDVPGAMSRPGSCRNLLRYLKSEALEVVSHGGLPAYASAAVYIPPNPLGDPEVPGGPGMVASDA
ncbi:MAG: hypothetical protein ACRDH5_18185, partial [bacterium]